MDRTAWTFTIATVAAIAALPASGRPLLPGSAVSIAAFTLLWPFSLVLRNAGVADVFWGPGFVLLGGFY